MSEPKDSEFTRLVNLASPRLGTETISCTDDFFAAMGRMLADAEPVFIEDKYDDNGKWMDGWESRRKRTPGHDHCLIRLGEPGRVHGVDIDTRHFTGNYPPHASLEGCLSESEPGEGTDWGELLPKSSLTGDARNFLACDGSVGPVNWLRLHIYPDGGVARLRVYGDVVVDWAAKPKGETIELSALANGGRIVGYNDAHYGNVSALLSADRGSFMGDGWETRRRREPGHDWIVIALGHSAVADKIEVDTAWFKGNYPDKCSLQAANVSGMSDAAILEAAADWPEIMAPQKLSADAQHFFEREALSAPNPITHIRLNIYPDGGVSRFRMFGRIV